jgi:hypothetical protein
MIVESAHERAVARFLVFASSIQRVAANSSSDRAESAWRVLLNRLCGVDVDVKT